MGVSENLIKGKVQTVIKREGKLVGACVSSGCVSTFIYDSDISGILRERGRGKAGRHDMLLPLRTKSMQWKLNVRKLEKRERIEK